MWFGRALHAGDAVGHLSRRGARRVEVRNPGLEPAVGEIAGALIFENHNLGWMAVIVVVVMMVVSVYGLINHHHRGLLRLRFFLLFLLGRLW